ncbi:MAG: aspartate--tRNA(Asn) ligase [Candidatus Diapherotrites archaeon]|nr:aspartate--tRNA(Asn) ligase [Candidatus Diapherotrites archaeon]
MERTDISKAAKKIGQKALLKGWVQKARNQSKVKFIILRDSTGTIQTVATPELTKNFEEFGKIPEESAISIQGIIKAEKQAPNGIELQAESFQIISKAAELPIPVIEKTGSETQLPKRLDWRSIDLRKPENQAIFKIQSALIEGMQECLIKENFQQVFTPCLMGVPSESGAELFEVKYFEKKAFLRQDPQLHRQLTIAGGIERLYDIGPSWRAEQSHTTKHLCEHRTCAVEFAFIESEQDTMRVEEQVIISSLKKVNEKCSEELKLLKIELKIPKAPFPELRFPEIYGILESKGKSIRGQDLDSEAEKLLWEFVQENYDNEFYFFNRFPSKIKPFYVMHVDEEPEFARSVDLNWKGLELSSGGQREHRYEILMKQVQESGQNPKSLEWFTKFFQYGVPTHGGFAIGIERLTKSLLNLPNIREAVLFPRDTERITP